MSAAFKGTRFEKLENKILNDINRRKKKPTTAPRPSESQPKAPPSKKRKAPEEDGDEEQQSSKRDKKSSNLSSTSSKSSKKVIAPKAIAPEDENEFNNNRTVYVSGLSFTCIEEDVRNFFRSSGEVVNIRLPKWHDSGRLRGYGHVEFKTAEGASKALERSGEYLLDRYLNIDRPMNPRTLSAGSSSSSITEDAVEAPKEKIAGCRTIFVKNLPYECKGW